MLSPNEVVKEVARLIAKDNICYIDKKHREITAIEMANRNTPEIALQISLLEEHIGKYIKVEPMSTRETIFIMKDFLLEVTDQDVKKELSHSLNRKNPMRNFLQIVESRIDINQHWTHFKAEQYEAYVEEKIIKDYNY